MTEGPQLSSQVEEAKGGFTPDQVTAISTSVLARLPPPPPPPPAIPLARERSRTPAPRAARRRERSAHDSAPSRSRSHRGCRDRIRHSQSRSRSRPRSPVLRSRERHRRSGTPPTPARKRRLLEEEEDHDLPPPWKKQAGAEPRPGPCTQQARNTQPTAAQRREPTPWRPTTPPMAEGPKERPRRRRHGPKRRPRKPRAERSCGISATAVREKMDGRRRKPSSTQSTKSGPRSSCTGSWSTPSVLTEGHA